MSEAIAFDTHRLVKNLTAGGFTEAQAEALADEQVHLLNSNLTTKSDIREVRSEIREAKSELELKIEQVRSDLELRIEPPRSSLDVKIDQLRSEVHKTRVYLSRLMLTGWVTQTGLLATLFWYFSSGLPGG